MTRLDVAPPASEGPVDCDGPRSLVVEAREVPLGGVRGMVVHRTLPHRALRDDSNLWVIEDGRLRVRAVTVVYRDTDYLYITDGINAGDQIILSSLDVVTDGMLVRSAE